MIARKRSRCACGQWVHPGMKIEFSGGRTLGCSRCERSLRTPVEAENMADDDDGRASYDGLEESFILPDLGDR